MQFSKSAPAEHDRDVVPPRCQAATVCWVVNVAAPFARTAAEGLTGAQRRQTGSSSRRYNGSVPHSEDGPKEKPARLSSLRDRSGSTFPSGVRMLQWVMVTDGAPLFDRPTDQSDPDDGSTHRQFSE
jgi:hypothetical protein